MFRMLGAIVRRLKGLFPGPNRQSPPPNRTHSRTYNQNRFSAVPINVDLNISLVFDISGSMTSSNKIGKAKESSIDMANSLKDYNVALGLISFGGRVTLETNLTEDFRRIRNAIKSLGTSGGTPFYEAIELSKREHLDRIDGEKALVVDTDGKPTTSSEEEILDLGQRIKEEGTRIITIGIGKDVNSSFLRKLASTPEDYYFAKAPEDIGDAIIGVTGSLVEIARN